MYIVTVPLRDRDTAIQDVANSYAHVGSDSQRLSALQDMRDRRVRALMGTEENE